MDVIIAFSCCLSILYRFQMITVVLPLFPPSQWFSVILHFTTIHFFFFSCLSTFLSLFINSLFWGLLTHRSKSLWPFCNSLLPRHHLLLTIFSSSTLLMWPPPPPAPPPPLKNTQSSFNYCVFNTVSRPLIIIIPGRHCCSYNRLHISKE